MNDFKKEYAEIKTEIDDAIKRVNESGWYILGEEVSAFEHEFAQYIGSKYCIGCANGLDALYISLLALGVGTGDEVITVSNTAVATVLAITNTGAEAVFAEVNDYYLMDTEKLEALITPKTKAVVPVHLFGQMVDMKALQTFAAKHNLFIVEDACQAHDAKQNGMKAGSIGATGCFSFYPTKNLGAYGDGGAIVTNDEKVYERCKMLRNYGQENRYFHKLQGINSRLDEMQAAILRVKLRHLDEYIAKRQEIAKWYDEELQDIEEIQTPNIAENNNHAFHLYVITAKRRDNLLDHLKKQNIQSLIHYPVPVHKQECYPEYHGTHLPKTENFSTSILSLPIHPLLTREEVHQVSQAIHEFYEYKK